MPMIDSEVYVYINGTGEEKSLFSDATGNAGTEVLQPLKTNSEGVVSFYCGPGRIRIDVKLDSTTITSTEDVIGDYDSMIMPIIGETPAGNKNSNNTVFTLENTVYGTNVALYVNGMRIPRVSSNATPSSGQFKVSGNTLTLGTPPASTDILIVDYYPIPTNV
jgi:hypothetical protein